jgi:methylmalonyl-CoA mutase N-terminal domain/subunit
MPEKKILNVTFDLPTQMGYDSDHPLAEGEVGRTGVAIDSIEDMQTLFKDIRLDAVSTSMTINATGYILLAFYAALAKKQGADWKKLNGTIQNDILKEYAVRGAYIYPPGPSMRIITDIFEWCSHELPKWNTISISGYHIRETGSTAGREIAFTLSNGKAYVKAAIEKGLDIDVFGKRLSFFFNAHNNLFGEVAKFRAARRMWARIMKDLGATDPGAMMLHTNGYDEAMSPPTADTTDPLAGSDYIETLTREVEEAAWLLIRQIDEMGGSVSAIEQGFIQEEIARSAIPGFGIDDSIRQLQTEKLDSLKKRRDPARVDSILQDLNDKASAGENIMPVVIEAVENFCTLGEIADTLREIFGEYK